jgi:hypothetical protein
LIIGVIKKLSENRLLSFQTAFFISGDKEIDKSKQACSQPEKNLGKLQPARRSCVLGNQKHGSPHREYASGASFDSNGEEPG